MNDETADRMMRVGVVGLGAMGGSVAARLLELGHPTTVFDINPVAIDRLVALGGSAADSAAEAASVDILLTSLPSDDQVRDVLLSDGLLENLAGGTLVDLSTVLPRTISEVAARAQEYGVRVVDAPISGGPAEARSGGLVLFAGADQGALDAAAPVLEALGTIEHVGPVGHGKAMKLVNNVMSIGNMTVGAEAFELGRRLGLDIERMFEIISHSGGRSHMFLKRMPFVLQEDFEPRFSLGLSAKDLRLALELARSASLTMPVAGGVSEVLERGLHQGLGGTDLGSVVKVFRHSQTPALPN